MILCSCKGLSESQIRDLVRSGWNRIDLLEAATGIGSECGSCWEGLVRVLDEESGCLAERMKQLQPA